jgi:hypothetical protein
MTVLVLPLPKKSSVQIKRGELDIGMGVMPPPT